MQTASFAGFLETIFYLVAFYYAFKFLARLFLPMLVKKVVQKAGENFQQQQSRYQSYQNQGTTREEIVSESAAPTKPRETNKVGEYVDYEEID